MAKKRSDSLQDETCVFCGKTQLEVGILVQGENASICDVCILHAHQIVLHAQITLNVRLVLLDISCYRQVDVLWHAWLEHIGMLAQGHV